jgi:hypothetical protein
VESDSPAEDGGVVDGGGAAEEDGAGGTEADGRGPDITDTMLIGLRILPGISLKSRDDWLVEDGAPSCRSRGKTARYSTTTLQ